MIDLHIDEPNEKQKLFLTATEKYVAFGGARGGGKSWSVRTKAKLLAINYPGIKILIVRRTYPELINNHIKILRAELIGIAKYNDKDKVLTFKNGSTINFQYLARDADLDRMQGIEMDIIFLDEATQLSEYQIKALMACLRGVNDFPKRCYLTCNPGGQGHGFMKKLWIDRRYEDGENPDDYRFIQSLVTDNKALMESQPDYIKQLEALPAHLRRMWLEGDWSVMEGMYFEEFADRPDHYLDRQWTHVIEPFEIPDSWTVMRVFDWGYHRPFACEWIFMDHDNVMYVGLELYGCTKTPNEGVKWTPDQVFAEIHRIESEHRWLKGKKIQGVADPAIWDAQTGESIAERAAKHQVFFQKGDHQRTPGWLQMHYRMYFDENGYPMMYFFKNCKGAIRTLPLLMYDEHKPEDIDTTGEDHIADALRYGCMARMIAPRIAPPKDTYAETPMAQYLDIPKEDIIARPKRTKMEIIEHGE